MGEAQKNVYELAQERLHIIFKEFDNICVSFSGGKDSGVLLNLCIDYIRRNNLKRKLCVYHMDYEIQYSMTIDYVDRILEATRIFWKSIECVCLLKSLLVPLCIRITGVPGIRRWKKYGCGRCQREVWT